MRRKIIRQGHNTLTISLPRKWCDNHNLKEGEEIELNEKGTSLLISKESYQDKGEIKVDITNLDRSTIILLLQSLYTYGYDNITITTSNTKAKYHWKSKEVTIPKVIEYAVSRLIGAEIISSSKNIYKIQVITEESKERFELILSRIFLLITDLFDSFEERYRQQDPSMIDDLVLTYLNARKFINHGLRMLNKFGHQDATKTTYYYSILMFLGKISETLKNLSGPRQRLLKTSKNCVPLISEINHAFKDYYDLFYKYNIKKIGDIHTKRDIFKRKLYFSGFKNLNKDDTFLIGNLTQVYEVLIDLIELKIAIGY